MTLTGGERESAHAGPECGSKLGRYALAIEPDGIVPRLGTLRAVAGPILMVVRLQWSGRRHQEEGTHIRAADAAQIDVRKAGEEGVGPLIWFTPPATILVIAIAVRAHDIEGCDRHNPPRAPGTGVGGAKIGGPDEGIHVLHKALLPVGKSAKE